MTAYQSRGRKIRAARWLKHGDHPMVKRIDLDPNDHPRIREQWNPNRGYLLGRPVESGQWIVEEQDGRIYILDHAEFEKQFEIVPK